MDFPLEAAALSGFWARVAATPISYVRDNSESNGLLGRVFETCSGVRTDRCVDS